MPTQPDHAAPDATLRSAGAFKGVLIHRGRPGYDDARRLWNGAIDRRPALIARCLDADDAELALRYATGRGLPVSVRSGGHNVAGSALCDDGVVIDLAALRSLIVDPAEQRIRVQPGAVWGDFDAATQVHGLATPAGVVSRTGSPASRSVAASAGSAGAGD